MWLLLILSVVSVAIILERIWFHVHIRHNFSDFNKKLIDLLAAKKYEQAEGLCHGSKSLEAEVAKAGLDGRKLSENVLLATLENFASQQKRKLDAGLVVLGTLGNNAPFIGLFGTVIGIIKAFNDLASNPDGGPQVVMAGISEALVATAVGLLVAIPAVIAYNAFAKMAKQKYVDIQMTINTVMTHLVK